MLQFKNQKGKVVREIKTTANGTKFLSDTFYQLTSDGEIRQSASRNANGDIISRTINEYRYWGKAMTVTLDYTTRKAHSGFYSSDGELTQQKTTDIKSGLYRFREIAAIRWY